jgi:uncharacterized protein YjbK
MERELKVALPDRVSFERVLQVLGDPDETIDQVNYYFDTDGEFLRKNHATVRARKEKGRILLTLKRGTQKSEGYFESEEIEDLLESGSFNPESFDPYARDTRVSRVLIADYGRPSLTCLGSIENRRRVYGLGYGIKIELDETRFPGDHTEFEIECESEDESLAREKVSEIIRKAGVRALPQTKTKHQRFLRYRQ